MNHAVEILRFVELYGAVKRHHVTTIFKERAHRIALKHLLSSGHLCTDGLDHYLSTKKPMQLNHNLLYALDIVCDFQDSIKSFEPAEAPVVMCYITHDNEFVEIVPVEWGMELLIAQRFMRFEDGVTQIYIVKKMEQVTKMLPFLSGTATFALISYTNKNVYMNFNSQNTNVCAMRP